jgi:hypothetical protein
MARSALPCAEVEEWISNEHAGGDAHDHQIALLFYSHLWRE